MAAHEVHFTVPARPLGKADIEFDVYADGAKLGSLKVSKGSLCVVSPEWPEGPPSSLGEARRPHGEERQPH